MKMKKGIALTACMMLMASSSVLAADTAKEGNAVRDLFSKLSISKYLTEDGQETELFIAVEEDALDANGYFTIQVSGEDGEIKIFNVTEEYLIDGEIPAFSEGMIKFSVTDNEFEAGEGMDKRPLEVTESPVTITITEVSESGKMKATQSQQDIELENYNFAFAVEAENGDLKIYNFDEEEYLINVEGLGDDESGFTFSVTGEDGETVEINRDTNIKQLLKKFSEKRNQ